MREFKTENIEVAYADNTIIKNLSIKIPIGKITTIIGPNGCGKSTLLKAIGRIMKTKNGAIYLDGKNIYELSSKDFARQLAILPQSPIAPEGLTARELVSYGRYAHQKGFGKPSEKDKEIVKWALEVTNLSELSEISVDNMSGGQRQRVWIAMALAQQTDMILLDEPTTYLDVAYQLEVLELLENLNKEHGCTIVMVLHDINMASRYADYLIALKNGNIVGTGTPKEVITKEMLREVYHIEADIMIEERTKKPTCISYRLNNRKIAVEAGIKKGIKVVG
ncbi:ABC transporter ATP-binding protein [Lachnotalea glycerini]|uniref:ABC transporter ATP-binding protein n=1 Tax=Lachnotalea glycerini TaxID=1763509 RepID=A0A371JKD9_9FIRM|nr:ABC transporter ATP-binding protein [Lachnotalea glycerini]RDY33204.1 ABC transporter ATP-binding protein [Lachnotalea glycerini]